MDLSRPWAFRGLVIALAVVVGTIVYLALSDGEEEPVGQQAAEARIVSDEELADVASTSEHPVYWAGEMADTQLELTEEEDGRTLVRYLEETDEVGAAFGQRIAIGSYPLSDPRKALSNLAETSGWEVEDVSGIGQVAISPGKSTNVYFVDPENEVQVEVYAPSAKRAIGLVRSGQVQPLG